MLQDFRMDKLEYGLGIEEPFARMNMSGSCYLLILMHVNATTEHTPGTCGGGGELSALPLPSHGDPVLRKAFLILQSIT